MTGTITETVNATDNVGVTKVEFLRDGVMYGSDTTAPYSTSVNTTTVSNGSHTFGARAYDAAGNMGTAANVTATVSNAAADTVAPTVDGDRTDERRDRQRDDHRDGQRDGQRRRDQGRVPA